MAWGGPRKSAVPLLGMGTELLAIVSSILVTGCSPPAGAF
jgi:hypothetical protein